jgi:hypothetical protein
MWTLSVERAPGIVDGFQQGHDAARGWHVVDKVPAGVAVGPVQPVGLEYWIVGLT